MESEMVPIFRHKRDIKKFSVYIYIYT